MIKKEGQEVEYDTYWKSIIKGLSLLVSCKTLAMDVSRLLFDSIWQYRENEEGEEKEVLKRLRIISHLLSRIRFIATPSNISRARYVREKLEVYIKAIDLPEIINNIEKDYDELNKAIHSSIESKTNERILCLTFLMVPLTIVATVGTVILVFIEDDCKNYFFGTILTIGIAIFIFLIFLYYFLEKGKKISRLFKRFQKFISAYKL